MPELDMIEARLANDFLIRFRRIRKKRNLAGAFDGGRDGALMLCAGSRLTPGANLSFFGYEAAEKIHVFIINFCRFYQSRTGIPSIGGRTGDCFHHGVPAHSQFHHSLQNSQFNSNELIYFQPR